MQQCKAQHDGIQRLTSNGAYTFTCTLPLGHASKHEDHVSDSPSILAWPMTVEERKAMIDTLRAKRDVKQTRDAMHDLQADWNWREDFILYVESQADETPAYIQAVKDELFK